MIIKPTTYIFPQDFINNNQGLKIVCTPVFVFVQKLLNTQEKMCT